MKSTHSVNIHGCLVLGSTCKTLISAVFQLYLRFTLKSAFLFFTPLTNDMIVWKYAQSRFRKKSDLLFQVRGIFQSGLLLRQTDRQTADLSAAHVSTIGSQIP